MFEVAYPVQSILKCGLLTEGIKLRRFVLFEVPGVPQL